MAEHPDLAALLEGLLTPEDQAKALKHLSECDRCRQEYEELKGVRMELAQVAKIAKELHPDPLSLGAVLDEVFGPVPGQAESGEDFVCISPDLPPLPPALQKALRDQEDVEKDSVKKKLAKAIKNLAGKSGRAARAQADRIMGGDGFAAAPAAREDATLVEEDQTGEKGRDKDQED